MKVKCPLQCRQLLKQAKPFLFLLFGSIWMLSCQEEAADADPVAGKYTLLSAILTEDTGRDGLTKGADVSRIVKTAFFSVHMCQVEGNLLFELRENNEFYFTCKGESNMAKAGTWSVEKEGTELRLNLAKPLFPIEYTLKVENLKIDNNVLSGNGNRLPIPMWIVEGKTPPQDPLDGRNPDNIPLSFSIRIEFSKS